MNPTAQDLHKNAYKIGLKCYTFSDLDNRESINKPKLQTSHKTAKSNHNPTSHKIAKIRGLSTASDL